MASVLSAGGAADRAAAARAVPQLSDVETSFVIKDVKITLVITPNTKHQTPNPKPQTPNPTPQTLNPKPHTPHPTPHIPHFTSHTPHKPQTLNLSAGGAADPRGAAAARAVPHVSHSELRFMSGRECAHDACGHTRAWSCAVDGWEGVRSLWRVAHVAQGLRGGNILNQLTSFGESSRVMTIEKLQVMISYGNACIL